jgi:hypothetical protein
MRAFVLLSLSTASAWRVPPALAYNRRGLMQATVGISVLTLPRAPAEARPTELANTFLSKEELYAAAKARSEEEKVASLPINQLKASRTKLSMASELIDSGSWTELRDVIQATTGPKLSELLKDGGFVSPDARTLTIKLRKDLFNVDKFAYSQQSFPGSDVFAGYCAEGVVPREKGGCKVKPVYDKAPLNAAVNDALADFDALIKACEA